MWYNAVSRTPIYGKLAGRMTGKRLIGQRTFTTAGLVLMTIAFLVVIVNVSWPGGPENAAGQVLWSALKGEWRWCCWRRGRC